MMKKSILMLILAIVLLISGCAKDDAGSAGENSGAEQAAVQAYDVGPLDAYMTSVEEQSHAIKTSLEQDVLTQTDMNMKAQELYTIWDDALNYLWGELKTVLSEEEFAKLTDEQLVWIGEKEAAVQEAGKEFEGGSIYPLIVNSEAARITEERVYRLYTLLQEAAEE